MYEEKLSAAEALLEEHNTALGTDSPGRIETTKFIQMIKAAGGSNEDRLAGFSHEDIIECLAASVISDFPSKFPIQPRVLAKEVAKIFRGKDSEFKVENLPQGITAVTPKKVNDLSLRELVERLDPTDPGSKVGIRLHSMSKGQKFIVFLSGQAIDVDTTVKILSEVKQGFPGRENIEINGAIKMVYALGQLPDNYADENPLYPGRPLRPDGTCDQTGRSWEGVSQTIRQLVYLAINETNELSVTVPNGIQVANDILNVALASDGEKQLRSRFRKTSLKFDELSKTGNLPNLKISLSNGEDKNNPFDNGKKVVWATSPVSNSYRARR